MSKIVLFREMEWADRLRVYQIIIDGVSRGKISQKQSVELDVSPGTHQVQLKIDWCRSPTLDVLVEGEVRLGCKSNVNTRSGLLAPIFQKDNWISLWREN